MNNATCLFAALLIASACNESKSTVIPAVTAAPLQGDGTAGAPLSLPAATATTPGHLTAIDWARFDAKVSSVTAGEGIAVGGTASGPVIRLGPGRTPASALASCKALFDAGVQISGPYFIKPASTAFQTWCDMETNGGGWALVYNSVLGTNTTEFWQFPYADRLETRGMPTLATNYYRGALYSYGTRYLDVIEDLRGKVVVAFEASATGFDAAAMTFTAPTLVAGNGALYDAHFAAGWSSADFDGDPPLENCAVMYANVSQHYASCWGYSLGADGDAPYLDGSAGPHLLTSIATELGLGNDGTYHTRVRRISRFARW